MFRSWSPAVRTFLGNSHSLAAFNAVRAALQGEELDFLFIDGDHRLAGVQMDYFMYRSLVRPGGYIAFHDINDTPSHRRLGCHVGAFWDRLREPKREFNERKEWAGIGVVQVV
jgi:hypothetical protein